MWPHEFAGSLLNLLNRSLGPFLGSNFLSQQHAKKRAEAVRYTAPIDRMRVPADQV